MKRKQILPIKNTPLETPAENLLTCTGYGTLKKNKDVVFHPKAQLIIRSFPKSVRIDLGEALTDLQLGHKLEMPLSRAMPSVSLGVFELRLKDRSGIYRVFYFLKASDKILVFHAFQKKTQKTPLAEIRLAQRRLKEVL